MAVPSQATTGTVKFGEFELDLARAELRKTGVVVNLAPQPLRVLVLLASHAGELVTRETIRQKLWGDDFNVDSEHGLNTCIRQIRAALGDEAQSWRFIETVHRRGYRFHMLASSAGRTRTFRDWRLVAGLVVATTALAVAGYTWVASRHRTRSAEAHDLVVKGTLLSDQITTDAEKRAIASFEKALALEPGSAAAHAGLAMAYLDMASDGGIRMKDAAPKVKQEAGIALALDSKLADAHVAVAEVKFKVERDLPGAELEFRRALALDPKSAQAHGRFSNLLMWQARFGESETEIGEALAIEPESVRANYQLACVKYYGRDYDAAIAQARRTLGIDRRYAWAHHVLGLALLAKRNYDEAIAEIEKSQRGPSGNLGNAYAVAGRRAEALRVLEQLKERYNREGVGAGEIARVYVGFGENGEALEWLKTAGTDRGTMPMIRIVPTFDPLRNDPRFEELLRNAGAPIQETYGSLPLDR